MRYLFSWIVRLSPCKGSILFCFEGTVLISSSNGSLSTSLFAAAGSKSKLPIFYFLAVVAAFGSGTGRVVESIYCFNFVYCIAPLVVPKKFICCNLSNHCVRPKEQPLIAFVLTSELLLMEVSLLQNETELWRKKCLKSKQTGNISCFEHEI
ncbi:hypothetical protein SLA2020_318160 [Shorea laevis]